MGKFQRTALSPQSVLLLAATLGTGLAGCPEPMVQPDVVQGDDVVSTMMDVVSTGDDVISGDDVQSTTMDVVVPDSSTDDVADPDGGSMGALCETMCLNLQGAACGMGMAPEECIEDCEQERRTMARRCLDEHTAYLACAGTGSVECATGDPVILGCDDEEIALELCSGTEDPTPDPGPGELRPTWVELGPGACKDSSLVRTQGRLNNVQAGGVNAILPHPTNADLLFLAAVGGGIWRCTDATTSTPNWTPVTDTASSLSISSLAFDVADTTQQKLIAGLGRLSNFAGRGGRLDGLLKSIDGGATWTPITHRLLLGANLVSVAQSGETILAGSSGIALKTEIGDDEPDESLSPAVPALFRSTDGGQNFSRVRSLPVGSVRRLLVDPASPQRVFLGLLGPNAGVFRSDDFGATWVRINDSGLAAVLDARATNVQLAVHHSSGNDVLWVAVARTNTPTTRSSRAAGVFRSTDAMASTGAATWTAMDLPSTVEPTSTEQDPALGGMQVGINPGSQGASNLSFAADPVDPNVVYIAGDRVMTPPSSTSFGSVGYTGRMMRGNATGASGEQWTPLTDNFADPDGTGAAPGSAPHADSRAMVFRADGLLLEASDGGLYARSAPRTNTGEWTALITPSLGLTEAHDAAWDRNFNVAITGNQDNGVCLQDAMDSRTWTAIAGGDGGDVLVDDRTAGTTVYYYSSQSLGGFRRRTRDGSGDNTVLVALRVMDTGMLLREVEPSLPFTTPLALHASDSNRILIAALRTLYESNNQGDDLTPVPMSADIMGPSYSIPCRPIYGGRANGSDNPHLIYAGMGARSPNAAMPSSGILLRRLGAGEALQKAPGYTGSAVDAIAVDPENYNRVYVFDDVGRVWGSPDAGMTFTELTGDLDPRELHGATYVPAGDHGVLLIGGTNGVFAMRTDMPGRWKPFGFSLPNTRVYDLRYNAAADTLITGTLGRGAWLLREARRAATEFSL